MSNITIPNVFVANTLAQAAQVNANFAAVTNVVNGNLDSTNINPSVGIDISLLTGIAALIGSPGTITIAGGGAGNLVVKWGRTPTVGNGASSAAVTFATPFPTAGFLAVVSIDNPYLSNAQNYGVQWDTLTQNGFNITAVNGTSGLVNVSWIALGY